MKTLARNKKPALINAKASTIQLLNVVKDPQNPTPKNNLDFLEIDKALIKPRRKQPIIFTIYKIFLTIPNLV